MKLPKTVKTKLIVTIIAIISVIMLLISVTFSWFTTQIESRATGMVLDVTKTNVLKISDSEIWGDEIDFTLPAVELKPICGDGTNFYRADFDYEIDTENLISQDSRFNLYNKNIDLSSISLTNVNSTLNNYAYTYNFKIKSVVDGVSVSLSDNSYFGTDPSDSDYCGLFGALRVALYEEDSNGDYQLKFIWFPNAQYEGNSASGNIEDEYILITGTDYVLNRTVIETDNTGYYYDSTSDVYYIWDASLSPELFTMNTGEKNFRIVAWLEGTDRECVSSLFEDTNPLLYIKFTGI